MNKTNIFVLSINARVPNTQKRKTMNMNKLLLIIFLCGTFALNINSQNISFHYFTTDNGLSHNSVMSIYQDERGFIWLGTRDGVSVYNGKEFKVYKHEKNTPNSIPYNDIGQITGDGKGKVYIMTNDKGISKYDIKQDVFSTLIPQKATAISYNNQTLYFACDNRLYKYQKDAIKLIYEHPNKETVINHLYRQNDSLLIGTFNAGLYLLQLKKKALSHIIPTGRIYDIFKDSSGWLWVSHYSGEGLFLIKNGEITNFRNSPNDPESLSSSQVNRCCEDRNGDIWIGTFNGLNKYNKRTGKFTRYYKQIENNSLSESSIWSLWCDHQGTIWAGTYYGGVNYFNPGKQIYREYNLSLNEPEGLSSSTVGQIIEDKNQNLWICTEGGGVCSYNLHFRKFQWYIHTPNPNSISHNHAKAIYYDPEKDALWIGTHLGGLNKLDIKTKKFTHYTHQENDPFSLPTNIVMDIVPYGNQLILGSIGKITIFDPQTGKCSPLFSNKEYNSKTSFCKKLAIDHRNVLWIANPAYGVSTYNFSTKILTTYQYNASVPSGISSDHINYIYEDSQHRLWLCTNEHGLDLYHYETKNFENFDMKSHGLPSDVIYAICELSKNQLLVTTDNGYSIFDYDKRKFTNYNKGQKIPLTCINENSLYKTNTGEIFIGGMNGMISFYEKDIIHTPRAYKIYPYQLTVNGQDVNTGDDTDILSENVTTIEKLILPSQYNIFSLEYTATDYLPYDKEELVYHLEGFSDKWVNMRDKSTITFTNLSPGTYTLVVKTANVQNHLVPENRLIIKILPPFYKTIWAYLFYILCTSVVIFFLIRAYNNQIKLQESLKYEKQHAEDLENLNQAKLRFFTNISHEFRTPLTIIIGQMELLLQSHNLGSNIYNPIFKVYKSCLQLRELITELLDFRKQEQGYMTIKVSQHNIVDAIYEHFLMFQEYATQKQITYRFIKTSDDIQIWYDAKQLQKVMNNLISNAFKNTSLKGEITVSIRRREQEVFIEVTDNGKGIEAKDIDKVFNRFYQTDSISSLSYIGTGIGLSLSKGIVELHHGTIEVYSDPGVETTFIVHLKTGKEHFKPEEINECSPNELQEVIDNSLPDNVSLAREQSEDEMPSSISELKAKGSKVLIVEDNDGVRDMLTNLFSPFYTITVACDGKEGWEKVKVEQPDIVVSDIVMPHVSGIELCKMIKEDLETCHIPVVLLTAKTALEYNLEGLKTGADDYITKPFNIQLLLSRCNNLVNNRIMLQEKFSNQPQSTHKILANNVMDNELMDNAMKVILKHIDNIDFSMDIFARELGIARTKLFTKLKAITGQTPAEFILTIRLKEAAILLKNNPEFNITEIADKLGFSSPKYFRKCFKDKYHISPLEYRRGDNNENGNNIDEDSNDD